MRCRAPFLLVFLGSLLLSGTASADAVMPPPTDCPPGSTGTSSHNGPYCRPVTCDQGCPAGTACKEAQLCIDNKQLRMRSGAIRQTEEALSSCSAEQKCAKGTCRTAQFCVSESATPLKKIGCKCAFGPEQPSPSWLVLPALALVLFLRRRSPTPTRIPHH